MKLIALALIASSLFLMPAGTIRADAGRRVIIRPRPVVVVRPAAVVRPATVIIR